MKTIIRRNKELLGHVGGLAGAKAVAAVFALAITPIISRLFSPNDFGQAALWLSWCTILGHMSSLKYELAVVLPREEREAAGLYWLSVALLVLFTSVVALLLFPTQGIAREAFGLDSTPQWVWWLIPGLLLFGLVDIQQSWLARFKRFYRVSGSIILGTVTTGFSRIGLGLAFGSSPVAFIVGQLIGLIVKFVYLSTGKLNRIPQRSDHLTRDSLLGNARRFADFPKLNTPAALASSAAKNVPVLFLGALYGAAQAGLFAMAMRLAQSPIRLATRSMRSVLYQRLASIANADGKLFPTYAIACGTLAAAGLVPMLVLVAFGPPILGFILGPQWVESGVYLQIIAPWLYAILISIPVNPVLTVIRRQGVELLVQIASLVIRTLVFVVAFRIGWSATSAVAAFSAAAIVINLTYVVSAGVLVRKSDASSGATPSIDNAASSGPVADE